MPNLGRATDAHCGVLLNKFALAVGHRTTTLQTLTV